MHSGARDSASARLCVACYIYDVQGVYVSSMGKHVDNDLYPS